MRTVVLSILGTLTFQLATAQNCDLYLQEGDTLRHKACLKMDEAGYHYQFKREFQQILDTASQIDPTYYMPYKEKAVAYLKSGDFISWKRLIDRAVEADAKACLGYRASCRYQFFRDYEGCIKDIEQLDEMVDYDIGEIHNGDYHLHVIRAISYDALGDTDGAIEILNKHFSVENYFALLYDYLLQGMFYLKKKEYEQAKVFFEKQVEINDIAENQFYLAKVYEAMGDGEEAKRCLLKASEKYEMQYRMYDPYTEPYGKIYRSDIDDFLERIGGK